MWLGALGPADGEEVGLPFPEDWPWEWNHWRGTKAGALSQGTSIPRLSLNFKTKFQGAWMALRIWG